MPPTTRATEVASPPRSTGATPIDLAIAAVIIACFGPAVIGRGFTELLLWCWCQLSPSVGLICAAVGLTISVSQVGELRRSARDPAIIAQLSAVDIGCGAMLVAGVVALGAGYANAWWIFTVAVVIQGVSQATLSRLVARRDSAGMLQRKE